MRDIGGDRCDVESAGIEAHGKNPRAIATMEETGLDISSQESSVLSTDMLQRADVVITVCGHADEQCPILPPGVRKLHWPLTDPAKATGTDEEIALAFRNTRDEIERRVRELIATETVLFGPQFGPDL